MSTIYVPVLIESAEQAEALPADTIAYLLHDDGFLDDVAVKHDHNTWARLNVADGLPAWTNSEMTGWTALIPIEAEEEHAERAIAEGEFIGLNRFVTPWREA